MQKSECSRLGGIGESKEQESAEKCGGLNGAEDALGER